MIQELHQPYNPTLDNEAKFEAALNELNALYPRFKIGQKYKSRGKHPKLCTVKDILKTYNSAGELVRIRYVATHEFSGQIVTDYDVVDATIARGVI